MFPPLSDLLSRHLLDRAGGHRRRVLEKAAACREIDIWAHERMVAYQEKELARLLTFAGQHVPRFRRELQGQRITEAESRSVLLALPRMQRADVQQSPEDFVSATGEPYQMDATGGSTGTPMAFRVNPVAQVAREASLMWADGLAGWRPGERLAMLWGSDRDVRSSSRTLRLALRNYVENRRWYNAFDMSPEKMAHYHSLMTGFQPHLLVAYASAVHMFARFLQRESLRPAYPLRAIVSSAEVITGAMRRVVEDVFRTCVFDRYGNREVGAIAAECGVHEGLHVNESDVIVEIDSPDPYTVPGPILITCLWNRAMPFIRYDTGDLGCLHSAERCSCGRSSLRIAPVTGRRSDTIQTADGKCIHGEFFTHILYGARAVQKFQFIQESLNRYRLLLVADRQEAGPLESSWRRQILDAVGDSAELVLEYVDDISPLPSGKYKFTISRVPENP